MIKGIAITLYEKTRTGKDAFNRPTYTQKPVTVNNVLIAPVSSSDIVSENDLSSRKAIYELAIPKGDTHIWTDVVVEFFGERWRTVGIPICGQDELIPLDWNQKIQVERYE